VPSIVPPRNRGHHSRGMLLTGRLPRVTILSNRAPAILRRVLAVSRVSQALRAEDALSLRCPYAASPSALGSRCSYQSTPRPWEI
jgi:hypothetical protein